MSLYKRPDSKYWWTNFWINGKHYQFSCKTANKKLAKQVEIALQEKMRIKLAYGIEIDYSPPAFSEAAMEYLDSKEITESSRARYKTAIDALVRYFGDERVSAISTQDVERYKAARLKKTSPATVKFEIATLKGIYKQLVDTDVLMKSPIATVRPPKVENITDRVMSDSEMEKYLAAAPQPLKDFAVLMSHTGCRPVELLSLSSRDVDGDKLIVRKGKTRTARRAIPLTDTAREILDRRPDGFPRVTYQQLNRMHNKAVSEAGIEPAKLYSLRHRFATELIAAGVNDSTVAKLMGHSDLSMLKRYVHLADDHLQDAIRRLE